MENNIELEIGKKSCVFIDVSDLLRTSKLRLTHSDTSLRYTFAKPENMFDSTAGDVRHRRHQMRRSKFFFSDALISWLMPVVIMQPDK